MNLEDILILPQTVKIKLNSSNKKHYESKGYIYTKKGDEIEVSVLHLTKTSDVLVKCRCQICNSETKIRFIDIALRKIEVKCKDCIIKQNVKHSIDELKNVLVLPQTTKVRWNRTNKRYYESRGYIYTKNNDEFEVNVLDLRSGSCAKVKCICQYCGKIMIKEFREVVEHKNKLCCKDCVTSKFKEFFLEKYGVENPMQVPEIKQKSINTTIQNNGGIGMQSKKIQQKIRKTLLKEYNVTNPSQIPEVKIKKEQTCLKNWGVKSPAQSKEIQEKTKQNNFKKYGYYFTLQVPKFRNEAKAAKTLYQNGNGPSSKQQKYLCNLLKGKLNYPIDKCRLDIAFLNEMIYIEYDGSGHDLSVKYGTSIKEFKKREIKRKTFLENKGWKLIRIISSKDLLPRDEDIINLINECKNYLLNSNHTWIEISIDDLKIKCSQYEKDISYLKESLRKIK